MPPVFGEFTDVRCAFDIAGKEPLLAIDQISYELEKGRLVSLLGPSGCGKTTFLRIAAGLTKATGGSVKINGVEVTEPHTEFSFMFQTPNLMPWRSVFDNIMFPMEILKRKNSQAKIRAMELLDLVGLSGFESVWPDQLSGGMKQRVALCRALIHEPNLMLMDEPFGALDELTRMEMHDLLLNIHNVSKTTIMFVTHSISEAVYLSDTVLVFSKRPAVIADLIDIDLPYPRTPEIRYSQRFTELEHRAGVALGISK
ncbi:MAG: ABC transporter ATP-binding protein [Rhodospirillales bacterium]|nr:ABC transporter ATP-binding protein [Rhodospirillales bacterium]MDP6841016.1 ABC transporter ATP-binding protein [Rhodospirillales bacterium]